MKYELRFTMLKETKGAIRYQEVDSSGRPIELEAATIGTLYVRKSAIAGPIPQTLTITVETAQ
jgi:hypothetical protein